MNIFILNEDPKLAAIDHCDKHVVKMHVEGVQMLVSVLQRYNTNPAVYTKGGKIHKGGYANHPCTLWAGDSLANFKWLLEYTEALCREHTHRYGTYPVSYDQCETIRSYLPLMELIFKHNGRLFHTPFAQAMPDEYRNRMDAVAAYREYYVKDKAAIAKWDKNRPAPEWYSDSLVDVA
jgi:hypothetical protein